MLENMIKVQEEFVQESRENLAIARVREKTGKCGYEEVFRWAGEVSEAEKKLLNLQAEYKNVKVQIWDTAGQERFRTLAKIIIKVQMG